LKNTNFAVFAAAGGRMGRLVGGVDAMWAELDDEKDRGTVRTGSLAVGPAELDVNVRELIVDLKAGYRLLEPKSGARQPLAIDLLAGGRYCYLHNEADLEFPSLPDRNFKESMDWIDPLVGVRVILGLTPRVQFTAIGDVGGWSAGTASDHTYQATGLLDVKLSEAWSLLLGYKVINIERGRVDLEMRGPVLGTFYRF
jgi:hypothetical protein